MPSRSYSVTCLFLGAGSSKALAKIPIGSKFLECILNDRKEWINRDNFKIGGKSLSEWMKGVGNIELCMSYLHSLAYGYQQADETQNGVKIAAMRAIINVRAAIAQYLNADHIKILDENEKEKNKCQELQEKLFKKFVNATDRQLIILTTNYDLVIEKLLRAHNKPYYYPTLRCENTSETQSGEGSIRLYKLHGSINWLEWRLMEKKTGELKSVNQPSVYVYNESLPNAENENGAFLFRIMEQSGRRIKTYNPILIPFIFQKDDWLGRQGRWKEIFREHWNCAKEQLKSSRLRIIFIGYSLPAADHHMLSWLLEILNAAKDVQVEIVNNGRNNKEKDPLEKALWPFIKEPAKDIFTEGLEAYLLNGMAAD